jgi:CheY-like chemotaxis protein
MVAEDNPINALVIKSLLSRLGITMTLVGDGQQAVNAITRGDSIALPDLILMDLHMPVMDGYSATEQIRQWEAQHVRRHLPIIALTADAFEEDRRRCLAMGMNDFLAKPIDLQALKASMTQWLPKVSTEKQS